MKTSQITALTLDLDDTLWPIAPTIRRAEEALHAWLAERAPATAAANSLDDLRRRRNRVEAAHPEWAHDLSAYRREAVREALAEAGDDEALAKPAFAVFFAERQRVTLFDDALPALERLAARYPLVAVSNGNADLAAIGLGRYFVGAVSAQTFGIAKPDARIFHEGVRRAGTDAGPVLHVGDDARLDVAGALGAGLQAAWVVRGGTPAVAEPEAPRPHYRVPDLGALCAALGC